jgi:hypothetical protein
MRRISPHLPTRLTTSKLHKPVSAAIGLAANAVEMAKREARQLPDQLTALPMTAATTVLQVGVVMRSHYDDLVTRGDEVLHIGPDGTTIPGKHESHTGGRTDDTVIPMRPPVRPASRFDAVADAAHDGLDSADDDDVLGLAEDE